MTFKVTSEKMQVLIGVLAILCLTAATLAIGQPTPEEKLAAQNEAALKARSIHIHPAELLTLLHGEDLRVSMLDVRSPADYEQFHIAEANNVETEGIVETILNSNVARYMADRTAIIVMSNDETLATDVWQQLAAQEKLHVYILEGGVNAWIDTFADEDFKAAHPVATANDDEPRYMFDSPIAEDDPLASPDPANFDIPYETKVHMEVGGDSGGAPAPSSGGCG